MNSDFENIIYLFDNREELTGEILQSPNSVRSYLQAEITVLLANPSVYESIYVQLERSTANQRTHRILEIWRRIISS